MNNPTINKLLKLYPRIKLQSGESFYWSPEKELIVYNENLIDKPVGKWALFHEVAHANLGHVNYSSDLGLLKLEVAAWEEAKIIASRFRSEINEDHIQDCLYVCKSLLQIINVTTVKLIGLCLRLDFVDHID